MITIPTLGLTTKLVIVGGLIALVAGVSSWKTYQFTRDHYEAVALKDKIITVEKTVKVKELDTLALTRALQKQEAQFKKDQKHEQEIYNWLLENKLPAGSPVCPITPDSELNSDGLRLWNSENRGVEVR